MLNINGILTVKSTASTVENILKNSTKLLLMLRTKRVNLPATLIQKDVLEGFVKPVTTWRCKKFRTDCKFCASSGCDDSENNCGTGPKQFKVRWSDNLRSSNQNLENGTLFTAIDLAKSRALFSVNSRALFPEHLRCAKNILTVSELVLPRRAIQTQNRKNFSVHRLSLPLSTFPHRSLNGKEQKVPLIKQWQWLDATS